MACWHACSASNKRVVGGPTRNHAKTRRVAGETRDIFDQMTDNRKIPPPPGGQKALTPQEKAAALKKIVDDAKAAIAAQGLAADDSKQSLE